MNTKRDEVIVKLKKLVKDRIYTKSSKLPPELTLATMLVGVRSLLREAIITLEACGVLTSVER